jgi:hypothetical protein
MDDSISISSSIKLTGRRLMQLESLQHRQPLNGAEYFISHGSLLRAEGKPQSKKRRMSLRRKERKTKNAIKSETNILQSN